ncbi:MAG: 2-phosphosulfolactate phosphatase family protein [Ktedonobacteraceae bacterium]
MQLRIFFHPVDMSVVETSGNDIYIVIDVIRATTTLTTVFARGAIRVYAANSLEQARNASKMFPHRLLCGERHGLPVAGFDYGNSPAQFAQTDLTGRELILTTTNGTRAFYACPMSSTRFAGCFYNAHAVTAHALALAQEKNSNIVIVCAAEANYFALDDATCAGYLAQEIQQQYPMIEVADDVRAGQALYEAFAPPKLTEVAHAAQSIIAINLGHDLDYCMQIDGSTTVPIVVGREEETGLLIIEKVR